MSNRGRTTAGATTGVFPAQRRRELVFALWLLLTLVLLLMPGNLLGHVRKALGSWLHLAADLDRMASTGLADKLVHGLLFAGLGLLATHAWLARPFFARVVLALLLLGAATEMAQHFVPGRGASLADFVADGLGLLLGVAGAWYWRRTLGQRVA